jgi:hypothetical protein
VLAREGVEGIYYGLMISREVFLLVECEELEWWWNCLDVPDSCTVTLYSY